MKTDAVGLSDRCNHHSEPGSFFFYVAKNYFRYEQNHIYVGRN